MSEPVLILGQPIQDQETQKKVFRVETDDTGAAVTVISVPLPASSAVTAKIRAAGTSAGGARSEETTVQVAVTTAGVPFSGIASSSIPADAGGTTTSTVVPGLFTYTVASTPGQTMTWDITIELLRRT
jgi:hypothetical protein